MLGKPGLAIVDYRSADAKLHGSVVSTFPITEKLEYTAERMAVILDLPPGTLTQRTLIYAVRVHPDKPASTDGEPSPTLLDEAQSHSQYQAQIRQQGHHFWATRFQRILGAVAGARTPREVCAESWPGQHLVDAAIECVRCWRLSAGHWSAWADAAASSATTCSAAQTACGTPPALSAAARTLAAEAQARQPIGNPSLTLRASVCLIGPEPSCVSSLGRNRHSAPPGRIGGDCVSSVPARHRPPSRPTGYIFLSASA